MVGGGCGEKEREKRKRVAQGSFGISTWSTLVVPTVICKRLETTSWGTKMVNDSHNLYKKGKLETASQLSSHPTIQIRRPA